MGTSGSEGLTFLGLSEMGRMICPVVMRSIQSSYMEVLCKIEKHYRNMPLHVCPLAQSPGASCKPGVLRPNVQREITPQVEDKV